MRIALVHPKFDRTGGAERYALGLAHGLAARGHEVHLFGRRAAGVGGGLLFHRVPALPLGRALKTWSFWRATSVRLAAGRFDVVQGFGKTTCQTVHRTGGGLHRAYLARLGTERRTLYDRVAAGIEDRIFASPALRAVICPSRWVAAEVESIYPAASPRVRVIPNGVDTAVFQPEGREADRKALAARFGFPGDARILLFAGTNFRLKGLDTAVETLRRLPEAQLLVAGGDNPDPFRVLAAQNGSRARIHFLGAVADMGSLYRAADVLIHPTRYDPFANVCLEALACGTPVITTDRNGASDILSPEAGTVVPVEDAAAAAAAAGRIFQRAGMAREAAREIALRNDVGNHVARVEALYVSIAPAADRSEDA